jgi:hypothetical protein
MKPPPRKTVNNVITASRMTEYQRCPRAHYWRFEIGFVKESVGMALRIGSAWASMLERWNGGDEPDQALKAITEPPVTFDEITIATLTGLFTGYLSKWGDRAVVKSLYAETPFRFPLQGMPGWDVAGVMDGLGSLWDDRSVLVESKTTGESIDPAADYWLRIKFNMQVSQYVLAARELGWDVALAMYDVTRKPTIRPRKSVDNLDRDGKRIVMGFVMSHAETPDEFCERLTTDCAERPDFYFARKEIPIIETDLRAFEAQRLAIAGGINYSRFMQKSFTRPEDAWPRAATSMNCKFCQFKSFCLADVRPDPKHPPEGFSVRPFNPELERHSHDIEHTIETAVAGSE